MWGSRREENISMRESGVGVEEVDWKGGGIVKRGSKSVEKEVGVVNCESEPELETACWNSCFRHLRAAPRAHWVFGSERM